MHNKLHWAAVQVLAAVFGPHEVEVRAHRVADRAIIKCEYGMAAFSTGARRPAVQAAASPGTCLLPVPCVQESGGNAAKGTAPHR